ncbi:MAG: tRNA (N(6)-L-threonylcarbamoyladenosine(37)-C(2))-methylthiotransferase MtaB [Elusimicrobia bacterium RIFCSPLOWO2_01_FULL_64_13]|nr:MAG: tRNA (N(6)-L-threonylcarbamoyladenosine(37)-C(2))-methylthiotransferase MtaB [Elusimicrobia bacterium RIFCSPLOWO2_01_FULL_64_13]
MPSVFFHTFGCKVNQYETESIRERLGRAGFSPTDRLADSDVCVVNSCSVTEEADRKCRKFLRKVLRENSGTRVLVTGCYATRDPEKLRALSERVEVVSNPDKDLIPGMVTGCSLSADAVPLLTVFSGHSRAFIKVQDGCDAPCTYCVIPKLRGGLRSRPMAEILEEVGTFVREGTKEIVLTGIRLGSYGLESSGGRVGKVRGNLTGLLERLAAVPGDFRIRLSSLEITEATDELLDLARGSEKICPHFHLPLQSGDDAVLRRMGRWYDSRFFSERIARVREVLPHAGLTTDVIVGFPGETEAQFENTFRFLEAHFNGMHVFPYSSRAGTPSARLPGHCDPRIIRRRVDSLLGLDKRLRAAFQSAHAGSVRMVLVENGGGFTDNGIRVAVPRSAGARPGDLARIRIPPPEIFR